jgi:Fic family protein
VTTVSDPFASVAGLPGVEPSVTAARAAVDALLGHRVLRRRRTEVTAESALRGARASAALEGADVALSALRSGVAFEDPATGTLARAAVRVSAEVVPLLDVWRSAPLQALARLHVVAAAGVLSDQNQLGRPETAEAAARLDQLSQLLLRKTAAPAIVVAAVVHGELLAAHPFPWGNGLVARAAQRLVLIQRGVDPNAVSIPEVGHAEMGRQAYDTALGGYDSGTPAGVAAWVRHCAAAVTLGAREGVAVCEALQRG